MMPPIAIQLSYITDTNFTDNECNYTKDFGTAGGGMRIGQYDKVGMENHVTIMGCNFISSDALNGGGVSVSTAHYKKFMKIN